LQKSSTPLARLKTTLRISYSLPFLLASLTGVAFALTKGGDAALGMLIACDVFVFALFANLANDYYDHMSGADKTRFKDDDPEFQKAALEIMGKRLYWDGNAFDLDYVSERTGKTVMGVLAATALMIGVAIVYIAGSVAVPLGLIAFFLSYFYTAPPLNLGARGLGELDVLASFACMSFFSYYVMVQEFSAPMLLIALAVGLSVLLMRLVDEMTGYEAHLKAGEKDLCVRLGLEGAVRLVPYLLIVLYALAAMLLLYSVTYALLFLTVMTSVKIVRYLRAVDDRFRFVRPVFETMKLAVGTEILVILALIAQTAWTYL